MWGFCKNFPGIWLYQVLNLGMWDCGQEENGQQGEEGGLSPPSGSSSEEEDSDDDLFGDVAMKRPLKPMACRSVDDFKKMERISEGTYGIVYKYAPSTLVEAR